MINQFKGDYEFLSNFYTVPIFYDNDQYSSVEHAFQAAKTHDLIQKEAIRTVGSPGKAKKLGKKVFLRPDWQAVKLDIMLDLLRLKFTWKDLRNSLLSTNNEELVEGNWWHDNVWGQCTCVDCNSIQGTNLLGKLLMQVRDEIQVNSSVLLDNNKPGINAISSEVQLYGPTHRQRGIK